MLLTRRNFAAVSAKKGNKKALRATSAASKAVVPAVATEVVRPQNVPSTACAASPASAASANGAAQVSHQRAQPSGSLQGATTPATAINTIAPQSSRLLRALQDRVRAFHADAAALTDSGERNPNALLRSFNQVLSARRSAHVQGQEKTASTGGGDGEPNTDPAVEVLLELFLSNIVVSVGCVRLAAAAVPPSALAGSLSIYVHQTTMYDAVAFHRSVVEEAATQFVALVTVAAAAAADNNNKSLGTGRNEWTQRLRPFEALMTRFLREKLKELPLVSPPESHHRDAEGKRRCCQIKLLCAMVNVVNAAREQVVVGAIEGSGLLPTRDNGSTSQLVEAGCTTVLRLLYNELMDHHRVQGVFRASVVGTTILTLVLTAPMMATARTARRQSSEAIAHTEAVPSPTPLAPPIAVEACVRFLQLYEQSFIKDQRSITSASEVVAWLDSFSVILRGYAATLRHCSHTTGGEVQTDSGTRATTPTVSMQDAAERVILTMTAADAEELLHRQLVQERAHQLALDRGSRADDAEVSGSSQDDLNLVGRVRSRRSLFGTTSTIAPSGDALPGGASTHSSSGGSSPVVVGSAGDLPNSTEQLIRRLVLPNHQSGGMVPNQGHAAPTTPHGVQPIPAPSGRFVKRTGETSRSTLPTRGGTVPSVPGVQRVSSSPLTDIFHRSEASLIGELRSLEAGNPHYPGATFYRLEAHTVSLAKSVHILWQQLERSTTLDDAHGTRRPIGILSSSRKGAIHHIASQVEIVTGVLLRVLGGGSVDPKDLRKSVGRSLIEATGWMQGDRMLDELDALVYDACGGYLLPAPARPLEHPSGDSRQSSRCAMVQRYSVLPGMDSMRADAMDGAVLVPQLKEHMRELFPCGSDVATPAGTPSPPPGPSPPAWLQADFLVYLVRFAVAVTVAASSVKALRSDAVHSEVLALARFAVGVLLQSDALFLLACRRQLFQALHSIQANSLCQWHRPSQVEFSAFTKQLTARAVELWVPAAALALMDDVITTTNSSPLQPHDNVNTTTTSTTSTSEHVLPWRVRMTDDAHRVKCIGLLETLASLRSTTVTPQRQSDPLDITLDVVRYCGRVLSVDDTANPEDLGMLRDAYRILSDAVQNIDQTIKQRINDDACLDELGGAARLLLIRTPFVVTDVFLRPSFVERRSAALGMLVTRRRHLLLLFLLGDLKALDDGTGAIDFQSGRGTLSPLPQFEKGSSATLAEGSSGASMPLAETTTGAATSDNSRGTLPPLFPATMSDTLLMSQLCIAIEKYWGSHASLSGRGSESPPTTAPPTATPSALSSAVSKWRDDAECDVRMCFTVLARAKHHPWVLLTRAFHVERNVRARLQCVSNSVLRLRTQTFLHLFALATPIHMTLQHHFCDIVLFMEDFLCVETPMTLLGLMREGPRSNDGLLPTTARRLRALFFGVKQVVLQLVKMEADMNDMFAAPMSSSEPNCDDVDVDVDNDDGQGDPNAATTTAPSGDNMPQTARSEMNTTSTVRRPNTMTTTTGGSYRSMHHAYVYALIAAFDLVIDCLRTHAFQKTLDASIRLLLNHSLVTCCQLLHRLLRRGGGGGGGPSSSTASRRCQLRGGTDGKLSLTAGIDGLMLVGTTSVGCFLATLLISDARHNYLQDLSRSIVHAVMDDVHRFVSGVLRRLPPPPASSSFALATTAPPANSDGAQHVYYTDATSLTDVFLQFARVAPRGVRRRCGFVDAPQDVTVGSVCDALLSMSLSSTLVRQSSVPGRTVRDVLQRIQQELATDARLAHAMEGVATGAMVAFDRELRDLDQRIMCDMEHAKREKVALDAKLLASSSTSSEGDQNASIEAPGMAPDPQLARNEADSTTLTDEADMSSRGDRGQEGVKHLQLSVDAQYLNSKVKTLERLVERQFQFDSAQLALVMARTRSTTTAQSSRGGESSASHGSPRSSITTTTAPEESSIAVLPSEEELFLNSVYSNVVATDASSSGSHVALCCSGTAIPMTESLSRFQSLFALQKVRFRGTSTLSRRNALATELLRELHGMVAQYGIVALAQHRPFLVASFLRTLRMARKFEATDDLCALIADQLKQDVNRHTAAAAQDLLVLSTGYHATWMEREQRDPSTYASRITGTGLFPGDRSTRYQSEDDLTVLEALASRLETYPTFAMGGAPSPAGENADIVMQWPATPAASATDASEADCEARRVRAMAVVLDARYALPVVVLFSLLEETRRMEQGRTGASALAVELAAYTQRRFVLPSYRVGPHSTVFEANRLLPLSMDPEEASWWGRFHSTFLGGVPRQSSVAPNSDPMLRASLRRQKGGSDDAHWRRSPHEEGVLRTQRNVAILLGLYSRAISILVKHRIFGDYLDNYRRAYGGGTRRYQGGVLEQRRIAARARTKHLTDPSAVASNVLESFVMTTQQWMVKAMLLGDSVTAQCNASMRPTDLVAAPSTAASRVVAKEVRQLAARAIADAAELVSSELQPAAIRRILVAPLTIFLCVPLAHPPTNADSTPLSPAAAAPTSPLAAGFSSASPLTDASVVSAYVATVDGSELPYIVQCPTLYDVCTTHMLNEIFPKIAEGCASNFTATIASVLDCKLLERPSIPLSSLVRAACSITHATNRRSQMLISLLYKLCFVIVGIADVRGCTSGQQRVEEQVASPLLVSEEEVAVFLATIGRSDVWLPQDVVVQTAQFLFKQRRDIFGDPPAVEDRVHLNIAHTAAVNMRRDALKLSATADTERWKATRRQQGATDAIDMAQEQPLPTTTAAVGSSPNDDAAVHDNNNNKEEEEDTQWTAGGSEDALAIGSGAGGGVQGYSMSYGMDQLSLETHQAAMQGLNFSVDQLMMLIMSYASRLRLKRNERSEGRAMIRAAMVERRERLSLGHHSRHLLASANRSEDHDNGSSGGGGGPDFSLRIQPPNHYGVVMLHHEFSLRKLMHAAARKTGVVQAPHTLADIVEALHEAEEMWHEHDKRDGMLNGTLNVLTEWALLRVEDAGCDGVEDRNQFVTPAGRLFGDMTLRHLRKWRRDKERRALTAIRARESRQWRVRVKAK